MLNLTQMTDDVVEKRYTLAKLTYRDLKDKVIDVVPKIEVYIAERRQQLEPVETV